MKLTQEIIDQIQDAMNHTKRNGDVNWQDGDEIDVCLAGTFAADRFIVIHNRTKSSTSKHNFIKRKNLIMTSITRTLILQLKRIANFIALEGENKECYWYGLTLTIYALIGDL